MKKIIFGFVMLMSVAMNMNAQKNGFLNYQEMLLVMPGMDQATAELVALEEQLQKQGEGMVTDLHNEYIAIEKLVSGASSITQDGGDKLVAALKEMEQEVYLFEQEMDFKLQKKESELMQPLLAKMNEAITQVAKENGMQFIFDQGSQMILFAEPSIDVTEMVKAKLGM